MLHALRLTVISLVSKKPPNKPLNFDEVFPEHYDLNNEHLEKLEDEFGAMDDFTRSVMKWRQNRDSNNE